MMQRRFPVSLKNGAVFSMPIGSLKRLVSVRIFTLAPRFRMFGSKFTKMQIVKPLSGIQFLRNVIDLKRHMLELETVRLT